MGLEGAITDAVRRSDDRANQQYDLEVRKFEAEERRESERLEMEKKKLVIEKANAQVAFVEMWKSLGLSVEDIKKKVEEMWE